MTTKFFLTSILIATTLLAPVGHAEDPPDVVFRMNLSPPETIFRIGFSANGDDRDLLHYVSGMSLAHENEAYIATTSSLPNAIAVCSDCAQEYSTIPLYIYYIRPTDNFHSVLDSVRFAQNVFPNFDVREELNAIWLATRGEMTHFWADRARISADQIMGVRRFYWNNGDPFLGDMEANPNYVFTDPEVSNYPMPIHNATVEAAFMAVEPHGPGFIGPGMADMLHEPPFQQRVSSTPSPCPAVKRMTFPELRSKAVAKLIVLGILSGSITGQLLNVPGHDEL